MAAPIRRTSWFVTVPVVAGAIGFLWLIFTPTSKAIRAARQEIDSKQLIVLQADSLVQAIALAQRDLAEAESFVEKSKADCPSSGQLSAIFGQLTETARQAGVTTTHFEPQRGLPLELLQYVPVKMNVTGSFHDFRQLLAALEALREPIWIDQLTVENDSKTGQNIQVELVFGVFADNFKKSD